MGKHALTLTHCEPERAVGHQDTDGDDDPNTGEFFCFACGTKGTFKAELTADAEPAADAS